MKKRMICLTLALSTTIGDLIACSSASSGTTGAPAAPASSTVSATKGADSQGIAWPEEPVQIIVGISAGGGTDTATRLIGKYMERYMGQSFVVTSTTGDAGNIAANDVKNAETGDYIPLVVYEATLTNKITGATDFDYNAFACVGTPFQVYTTYLLNKEYISVPGLVDAAKASPDTIKFGTELTTSDTIIIAMMEDNFGAFFQLVDAGVVSNQIASMMGNHIGFMRAPVGPIKDYAVSEDFRILAFFNQEHNPGCPGIPIMKEEEMDSVVGKSFGYFSSKNVGSTIIKKFSSALEQICQDLDFQKEVADIMHGIGYITSANMPAYFGNRRTRPVEYQDLLGEHYNK